MCTMTTAAAARINMRLSAEDDALIRRAAEASGATVTEFVVAAARLAAEQRLADQRIVRLDADAWDHFAASLDTDPTEAERAKIRDLFVRAGRVDIAGLA